MKARRGDEGDGSPVLKEATLSAAGAGKD